MSKYAIIPIEILADARLTPSELRVIIALFSFRDAKSGLLFPSQASISERSGIGGDPANISKIIKRLTIKGWVKKKKQVFNGPLHYEITIPELGESHQVREFYQVGENDQVELGETDPVELGETRQTNKPINKPINYKDIKDVPNDDIKPTRKTKPESWKKFFALYPANKKGGTDATPWKKAKSMKLTNEDFDLILTDVENRKKLCPSWYSTFAYGITKYLTERFWLTPIQAETAHGSVHTGFDQRDYESAATPIDQLSWMHD